MCYVFIEYFIYYREYLFFVVIYRIYFKLEYILGYKVSFYKYEIVKIVFFILLDYSGIKLKTNSLEKL